MRLWTTLRSPYGRKVRIVLLEKGLPFELRTVDLANRTPEFLALGPIAKVPVLEWNGQGIPDSTLICETLEDRFPSPPMYEADRLRSRILDELGDSVADQAITAWFARQRGDEAACTRALGIADRILADLQARRARGDWPSTFGIGDASLVSALGYLSFRHGEGWRDRHPELAAWCDAQHGRPSVEASRPAEG